MALVALRQVLDHAAEFVYGVPAFNVNNLEQVQAIMDYVRRGKPLLSLIRAWWQQAVY